MEFEVTPIRAGRLVRNAVNLIISGAGSAAFGLAFWGVAAHVAQPKTIGRTSAELAAMTLLATLAQLSFGSTFERFLPVAGEQTRLMVTRAYVLCVSIALVLAIVYVTSGLAHTFLPTSFVWRALFVGAVVCWTIFALQDSVLVGLRATRWVPVENILYSIAKLALIPAFMLVTAQQDILLAWLTPVIPVLIVVNWYLFAKRIPEHMAMNSSSEKLPSIRLLISLTIAQYSTLLVTVLSGSVVTLIVIDRLGAVASAHYYLPAQIAGGVAAALWSIDRSFLVEASSEPDALRRHARVALRAGLVVLTASVVLGEILAPEILGVFGRTYAADGTTLLRMFLLSLPGSAITVFYSSFAWIDKRVWILTIREIVSSVVYFAVIFLLIGHFGILAIGIASLVQSGLQGILFLPLIIRRYRRIPRTASEQIS
jgi:O-antigen/teichoic acid export membrane protein